MFNDFAVMCTWEGDNTVMAKQTARYLIKSFQEVSQRTSKLGPSVNYLGRMLSILKYKFQMRTTKDLSDPSLQIRIFESSIIENLHGITTKLESLTKKGIPYERSWNEVSVELVECSRLHCYKLIVETFIESYQSVEDKSIHYLLKQLCDLFVWHFILHHLHIILKSRSIEENLSVDLIEEYIENLCNSIREQAIPLVDAFNFPDFILKSPLGRYDGNIYTHYFNRVKSAPYIEENSSPSTQLKQSILSRL
jgi:acyl-CoA oxidase